jgi:hypothetical protein
MIGCHLDVVEQLLPTDPWILLKYGEQLDKSLDRVSGGREIGLADPMAAMVHERVQGLIRQRTPRFIAVGEHGTEITKQDQKLFRRQAL